MRYAYASGSAAADERARLAQDAPPAPANPAYTVLRPAASYDLSTPGTPAGLLAVARAAADDEGGAWAADGRFALAVDRAGRPVASLALRLQQPPRRAWVVYVRTVDDDGRSSWKPNGAALLDPDASRPMRLVGVTELLCILRRRPYVPPAPRPGPPRLRCYTCDKVTPFSTTTWRPYARHKCETTTEGRS